MAVYIGDAAGRSVMLRLSAAARRRKADREVYMAASPHANSASKVPRLLAR